MWSLSIFSFVAFRVSLRSLSQPWGHSCVLLRFLVEVVTFAFHAEALGPSGVDSVVTSRELCPHVENSCPDTSLGRSVLFPC